MTRLSLLFGALLVLITISPAEVDGAKMAFDYCRKRGAFVTSVMMRPSKAFADSTITFDSIIMTKKPIKGGTFTFKLMRKVGSMTLPPRTETEEICSLLKKGACPIQANELTDIQYTYKLPPYTPRGDYIIEMSYSIGRSSKVILCYHITIHVERPSIAFT